MLSVNRRSYVIRHVLILRIFVILKKLHFWQNREKMLNRLNPTSWAELHKATYRSHGVRSRAGAMGNGHGVKSRTGGIWLARSDLHLKMGGVITVRTLRFKRSCQLVVRLKANKYYQELLCSWCSYINLLSFLNLQGLRSWLLALSRFQNPSSWSRLMTNSILKEVLVLLLVFNQLFG